MWDYRNLLREVDNKDTQLPLGKYSYDALARRIRKISGDGESASTTYYLLDGNREVQERTVTGSIAQEYTFGIYIDEPLTLDKNGNADDTCIGTGDTRHFYQQNTLYSVYALTDADGSIKEGYLYDPYGRSYVITDGDDQDAVVNFSTNDVVTKGGSSLAGNPFLFTGRRRDEEVYGQYYYRARYLDWEQGRFLGRDLFTWNLRYSVNAHPAFSIANLFEYVNSDPLNNIDPNGMITILPPSPLPPTPCSNSPTKRKCGVKSFKFAEHDPIDKIDTITGGALRLFWIEIEFRNDNEYDPKCCRYIQWISGLSGRGGRDENMTGGRYQSATTGGTPLKGIGIFNVDSAKYRGNQDQSPLGGIYQNLSKDPKKFLSIDNGVGWPGGPGGLARGECVDLWYMFEGRVIDTCADKEKGLYPEVFISNPYQIKIKGCYPNLIMCSMGGD